MIPHTFLLAVFVINLAVITYQDFKHRSVPLYVFLFAAILSVFIQYQQCKIDELFFLQILLNSAFVAINALIVWLYIKKVVNRDLSSAIGAGDLAFYIVLIPLLSTPVYMYFHLISLLLILISYPFLKNILSLRTRAIPLAGLQALCLIFFILLFECVTLNRPIIGTCSIVFWI